MSDVTDCPSAVYRRPSRNQRIKASVDKAPRPTVHLEQTPDPEPTVLILRPGGCPEAGDADFALHPPVFLTVGAALVAAPWLAAQIRAHCGPIAKYTPALVAHMRRQWKPRP